MTNFQNIFYLKNKKLCKRLLRCIEAHQKAENILISKFLLNTFLHYFFSEEILFLEKIKHYKRLLYSF